MDLAGKIIGQRLAGESATEQTVDQFLAELNDDAAESSGAR